MTHDVQVTTLSSGLRVVSARMASAQSVSVGFWVNAGARDEAAAEHGIAHMLEHMASKARRAVMPLISRAKLKIRAAISTLIPAAKKPRIICV